MKPQNDSMHDRETLSALFDGELGAEARRFATRRLMHDRDWQADCGRWQLIGDAMRRQAPIAAPGDLAERVRREIATPPAALAAPASTPIAPPARRPVRRWVGAAVAASVALAAVLMARAPQAPDTAAPPALAAASNTVPARASVVAPASAPAPVADSVAVAVPAASEPARVAVAEERPSTRAVPSRPAPRDARRASRVETPAPMVAAASLTVEASNPFHVPAADPLSARPWPRAALPGAVGTFTASYGEAGESRGQSPSFYPFEPRLHDEASVRSDAP